MSYFWLGVMVVAIFAEALTVGLVAIWFALGALAAFVSAVCGAPVWLQVAWFLIITAVTLFFTRPLAQKYLNCRRRATNADRVLEMTGLVTERIDNLDATGTVTIDGKVWTARAFDGQPIDVGMVVRPVRIDGVKLVVVPAGQTAEQINCQESKQ